MSACYTAPHSFEKSSSALSLPLLLRLQKSVFELLAERQLIPAVNLIKLMLQSMREDGDATNEEAVAAMDTIWKLFGSKVQNDAEAALLMGLVNDFCRLLQQQLGEDECVMGRGVGGGGGFVASFEGVR